MKRDFTYLEIELTDDIDDCDVTNEINENIESIYSNCKNHKIISFETKILNSKSRYKTNKHFLVLGILILVEYEEMMPND